jgi:hypothetical protein
MIVPRARQQELVIQEIGAELVIYDQRQSRIVWLNPTAALVWQHCDGQKDVGDVAQTLGSKLGVPIDEDVVWLALKELRKVNLIPERSHYGDLGTSSRRDVLRKLGYTGGVSVLLPIATSIVAPTPAIAGTYSFLRTCLDGCVAAGQLCMDMGGTDCPGIVTRCQARCNAADP